MALEMPPIPPAMPSGGGAMPDDGQGAGNLPAPYVQGGALGAFGAKRSDHQRLLAWIQDPNIAASLDDDYSLLGAIGQRVIKERQIDLDTRQDWETLANAAMDLAMQNAKPKQSPWPGASNVIYPAMTTAAVQFAARAYPAIVQGRNVVKGVVIGPDNGIPVMAATGQPAMQMGPQGPQPTWQVPPGAKQSRANRIGDHMSWQLLSEMPEWEEETDQLLHMLPILGCVFRKSFFDKRAMRNFSLIVSPFNLVINFNAKSMETAPRLSEDIRLYPNEIEENVRAGLFLEHNYGIAEGGNGDEDAPHDFIEQHRLLDLDEDGYPEPYIVTVHKQTGKVSRIVARYEAEGVHISRSSGEVMRIEPVHYYTKYDFLPNPNKGIYGVGFGQLLGPINASINTSLNMLFDAGHLQNTGGGFIGRGLSMHGGSLKFRLGEWKTVNAPGQTVRDAIVPFNHAGPSQVLLALLQILVEAAKEVGSVKDALTGDVNAPNMQPTTLLALIEQGLKVFTAIYKRVHRSAKKEYEKLYRLNRVYMETTARYKVGDEWRTVTKQDYERGSGVEPVSDPAMVSDMQKMARTQFLMGFAADPDFNGKAIKLEALNNAGIDNPERFFNNQPPPPNPALQMKLAEMELEGHVKEAEVNSKKVQQLKDLTQAVLNLANADKLVGDQHIEWIDRHIDAYRAAMESLMQPAQPGQNGQPGQPPQGPDTQMLSVPHPTRALPNIPVPQAVQPDTDMSFHNGPFARSGAPPSNS